MRLILTCLIAATLGIAQGQSRPKEIAVFLACECPISQKYVATLNELYKQYGSEPLLKWHFIVPGHVGNDEVQTFIKEYDVRFPLTQDRRMNMVESFHANVTPQVVIVDGKTILYSGAIDNWFYGLGQYRQVITENYLDDALTAILAGKKPSIQRTEAIGCPIAEQ
jgi:hypothetical protein